MAENEIDWDEINKLFEKHGGFQAAIQTLEQFSKDRKYIDANFIDLMKRHPNKWIAVFKEELIAVSGNYDKLLKIIRKKNISPCRATIRLLSTKKESWILLRHQQAFGAAC